MKLTPAKIREMAEQVATALEAAGIEDVIGTDIGSAYLSPGIHLRIADFRRVFNGCQVTRDGAHLSIVGANGIRWFAVDDRVTRGPEVLS